jgi:hypothetical protein
MNREASGTKNACKTWFHKHSKQSSREGPGSALTPTEREPPDLGNSLLKPFQYPLVFHSNPPEDHTPQIRKKADDSYTVWASFEERHSRAEYIREGL